MSSKAVAAIHLNSPFIMKTVVSSVQQFVAITVCVLSLLAPQIAPAQAGSQPLLITFEGPPFLPPGTARIVQEYSESGFVFTPIDPNAPWAGFVRSGPATDPRDPSNGTAYLQAGLMSTLKFSAVAGSSFSLVAVDLAEYSTVVPDAVTVHFIGYRPGGFVITTDCTTDGIMHGTGPLADFQTFQFGPEWSGLTRVEIPTFGWSLDNLVVSIPEPASGMLLGLGLLGMSLFRRPRAASDQPQKPPADSRIPQTPQTS